MPGEESVGLRGCGGLGLRSVGGPERMVARVVNHHVTVVLHNQVSAGVANGARVPQGLALGVVDDQVSVSLHDCAPDVRVANGARVPQGLALRAIQDEIAISLHDERKPAVA